MDNYVYNKTGESYTNKISNRENCNRSNKPNKRRLEHDEDIFKSPQKKPKSVASLLVKQKQNVINTMPISVINNYMQKIHTIRMRMRKPPNDLNNDDINIIQDNEYNASKKCPDTTNIKVNTALFPVLNIRNLQQLKINYKDIRKPIFYGLKHIQYVHVMCNINEKRRVGGLINYTITDDDNFQFNRVYSTIRLQDKTNVSKGTDVLIICQLCIDTMINPDKFVLIILDFKIINLTEKTFYKKKMLTDYIMMTQGKRPTYAKQAINYDNGQIFTETLKNEKQKQSKAISIISIISIIKKLDIVNSDNVLEIFKNHGLTTVYDFPVDDTSELVNEIKHELQQIEKKIVIEELISTIRLLKLKSNQTQ